MTTFITIAARLYLDAIDKEYLEPDELDANQLTALRAELETLAKTPETNHDRAERGRLAVQIFNMDDDPDSMGADVIADILHWLTVVASPELAGAAYFRAARYYQEER